MNTGPLTARFVCDRCGAIGEVLDLDGAPIAKPTCGHPHAWQHGPFRDPEAAQWASERIAADARG